METDETIIGMDLCNDKTQLNQNTKKKSIHRRFLTKQEKNMIRLYADMNIEPSTIARKLGMSYRQVRSRFMQHKKKQKNVFTIEEDKQLISLYNQGFIKESQIAKFMPYKAAWMIRNRINRLKRDNLLDCIHNEYSIQMEATDTQESENQYDFLFDPDGESQMLLNSEHMENFWD